MAAEDTRRNRWLVGTMFFLGAFQTATNFEIMYSTFVSGYGRVLYWDNVRLLATPSLHSKLTLLGRNA